MDLDFLFVNAKVIDGVGNPWFKADVGVKGDRIEAVGPLSGSDSERIIEASGLVVAPGTRFLN